MAIASLESCNPTLWVSPKEYHDPLASPESAPRSPDPANEVDDPIVQLNLKGGVDPRAHIPHGCTQTLQILLWSRIVRPLGSLKDMLLVLQADTRINVRRQAVLSKPCSKLHGFRFGCTAPAFSEVLNECGQSVGVNHSSVILRQAMRLWRMRVRAISTPRPQPCARQCPGQPDRGTHITSRRR